MRIALLTYSTKPRGGVVHTLALAEALADCGDDVTVFSLGRGGDRTFYRPVNPAVTLEVVPFADEPGEGVGGRVLRSISTLAAALPALDFDVVHAQDCITANASPGAVRTVHHLDDFTTPELAECHERALRNPTTHICVSEAVAVELRSGWHITPTVIPNGVDAERFAAAAASDPVATADRAAWRDRLGVPYVLSVGGIEPRKGSIDLVEAFARLRATHPGAQLVIAGGETLFDYRAYRASFDETCRKLAVEPVILGPVSHTALPALVAGADVFAFPSTKEGFGMAALEACAAGVPLVLRELPVLREVFGAVGLFGSTPSSLAAALADALDRPDDARIAAGRRLAGGLTWSAAARRHRQVYTSLLSHDRQWTGRGTSDPAIACAPTAVYGHTQP